MTETLRVMSTLAVELAVKREILPRWTSQGHDIKMFWSPTSVLVEKIKAGARADVVIAIDEPIREMVARGILAANSVRPIAQACFGIAGRKGLPAPDISSVEKFKAVLLEAKTIACSKTGASGIHFLDVVDRLGIGAEIRSRSVQIPAGFTAEKVVSGEAELAVQQISELMSIDGVDVIGPFPEPLQKRTDFSAAIFAEAENRGSAEAFIDLLTSGSSASAYAQCGLTPRQPSMAA